MAFIFRVGILLLIYFACSGISIARDLEPRYVYYLPGQAPTFDSLQAALAYAENPTGPNITYTDLVTNNGWVYNGRQSRWVQQFLNSDYPGVPMGFEISMDPECPNNTNPFAVIDSSDASGLSKLYWCQEQVPLPEPDCNCGGVGNPILPGTATKLEAETDYAGTGSNALSFTRTYRSDRHGWANNYQVTGIDFTAIQTSLSSQNQTWPSACYVETMPGTGKPYCYHYYMQLDQSYHRYTYDFSILRGNGRFLDFGGNAGLTSSPDVNDRVAPLTDTNGNAIGYTALNASDDSTETYDTTGRLQKTVARNGQAITFTYSDSNTSSTTASSVGLLTKIQDGFGHSLQFTYNSSGQMATMTDPAGGIYTYAYDEPSSIVVSWGQPAGNLTSVTYPDGSKRIYWYNEQDKTANTNLPFALTGITDENGARFATWYYDSQGHAISTEHAGGIEKFTLSYPNFTTQSSAVDALGNSTSYSFQSVLGLVKQTGVAQSAGSGSAVAASSKSYDGNGNVASSIDVSGTTTTYTYDLGRNLETSRTEAYGTAQARVISTQWHSTYRLPVQITEPGRVTTFTHDSNGNLLNKTISAGGGSRSWSYTYNAAGQVLTETGPRTDVPNVTTYAYDNNNNLVSVANPLGQVTTYSNYDAHGRVGLITDPNGVTTSITYAPRGWITSKVVTAGTVVQTTSYTYDRTGQQLGVTFPDGSTLSYTYDDAHRLTKVTDSLGNSVNYTLDAMSNRVTETITDQSGALVNQIARVFDGLNRLQQVTGATR